MTPIKTPKKLIEVALPLDAINVACAREKSIRHGHPSTLHLWWARRPLAAARAVIFAQMVNDPGYQQGGGFRYGMNKAAAETERERLFKIIEDLVLWENTNNEEVLERARAEIRRSWRETCELNKTHPQAAELFNPDKLPAFHDPFAGGGALPLEAQRLGLESYASDLNPVAVTINKAMIEIPPKFAGRAPVGPLPSEPSPTGRGQGEGLFARQWQGAQGLAEDVRRYGAWMRSEAQQRIGHLYPQVDLPASLGGGKATVIAWLWARTVKSPNPAFSHVDVPLASTFVLSSKAGKEAYVQPVVEGDAYRFEVRTGTPPESAKNGTKLARGANFRCLMSDMPIEPAYIKAEGIAGRMGAKLMAIVAEGARGRVYLAPTSEHEAIAQQAQPTWKPETSLPNDPRNFWTLAYGLKTYGDLFTPRQLVALTTFSDLVPLARARVRADALAAGMADDGRGLDAGGNGATAYAEAVGVYLAFSIDKASDYWSSICTWHSSKDLIRNTFGRQAIPMTWDYAETNPFSDSAGNVSSGIDWAYKALQLMPASAHGFAGQGDAQTQSISISKVVSTDPPYYDNIGYADLSDFFYVWLRKSLRPIFPALYATLAVPKAEELVATPYRHGGKTEAEAFFLDGMTHAMHNLAAQAHPAFPVTIYYAFKQSDTQDDGGTHSTGWVTFLEAVLRAGFALTGTWPMRTELGNRMIGSGTNALASSIVLVCRQRAADAPTVSRREFIRELNAALPEALLDMTRGGKDASGNTTSPVAPVDLSQAIIGPGMAIFSQYSAVLEADGTPMSVRTALQLINRFFAEDDFDHDTQFCLAWFDQQGWATATRPNLRREMEERKRRFQDKEDVFPAIRERMQRSFASGIFGGTHIFTASGDVPDDWQLRLVVLPPDAAFSRSGQSLAITRATEILKNRGEQPRFKQNRLIFLAADADSVSRLKDQVRSTLAWQSIVSDIKEMKLNLDQLQARQAGASFDDANDALRRMVRETYKWMLAPMQEARPGKGLSELQWEQFPINPGAQNLSQEMERVLKDNELLITEWAPVHLAKVLKDWFWKDDVKEVGALNVWQQSCQQLYLPRLQDDTAFQRTMAAGTESRDFFGFAQGKTQDSTGVRYVGFSFGTRASLILDSALLLIEPTAAAAYAQAQGAAEEAARPQSPADSTGQAPTGNTVAPRAQGSAQAADAASGAALAAPAVKKQFYGTIELDPIQAKKQFADLVDEVVMQFTSRPGVRVKIAIEIQAESSTGFDDGLQRAVRENCKVLRFKNAEFEDPGE